jgi:hypothetical protein
MSAFEEGWLSLASPRYFWIDFCYVSPKQGRWRAALPSRCRVHAVVVLVCTIELCSGIGLLEKQYTLGEYTQCTYAWSGILDGLNYAHFYLWNADAPTSLYCHKCGSFLSSKHFPLFFTCQISVFKLPRVSQILWAPISVCCIIGQIMMRSALSGLCDCWRHYASVADISIGTTMTSQNLCQFSMPYGLLQKTLT